MTTATSAPEPAHRPAALDAATSNKLRALAMVGILAVIVGHSPSYRDPSAVSQRSFGYAWIEFLLSDAIPRVFVMVFFTVSGFLLLYGHDGSAGAWRRKLGARSRSLLLPYLVWSLLGLLIYFVLQTLPFTAKWFANGNRLVVGRSGYELLLFWLVDPIPYQLWFLRDLFLMVLCGPLLLWLLRRFGWSVPALLLVPYYLDVHIDSPVPDIRFLTSDCYLFFAVGGAVAVRGTLPRPPQRAVLPLCGLAMGLAGWRAWMLAAYWPLVPGSPQWQQHLLVWKTVYLVGVPAVWFAYDRWLRWLERPFWVSVSGLSFFVFVAHEPFMTMLRKPLTKAFGAGDLQHALQLVTSLLGTVVLVFAAGALLRRWLPRTFAFLCGGRA